jgi:putative membrane protein insertion efficiency factor
VKNMKKLALKLIDNYQKATVNSPKRCRYYPSCSQYAKEAFQKKNFLYALLLSGWRILRCNPFSKGGYDPLPGTHDKEGNLIEEHQHDQDCDHRH